MAGFHDFAIDYESQTATCKRCGRLASDAMNDSRGAACAGAPSKAALRMLRHIADGKTLARRVGTLFVFAELSRLGLIEVNDDVTKWQPSSSGWVLLNGKEIVK